MSVPSGSISPGHRRGAPAALLAVALAALTACGGADSPGAGGTGAASSQAQTSEAAPTSAAAPAAEEDVQTLTATEEDFSISLDSDELTAGEYEIEVVNEGGATHDLRVEQDGEDIASTAILAPGTSETLAVTLEPGEYVFYCSVGTHRSMGMEITVTVS